MCQVYFGGIVNFILTRQLMIVLNFISIIIIIVVVVILVTSANAYCIFITYAKLVFMSRGVSCAPIKLKRCASTRRGINSHSTQIAQLAQV